MLQAIAKKLETEAIFQVICDTLIVSKHLPPSSLINAVMDLVMTFKVTSNNIERGRGGRNVIKFSICFQECIFRWKSIFLAEYINNFATACRSTVTIVI